MKIIKNKNSTAWSLAGTVSRLKSQECGKIIMNYKMES